MVAIVVIKNRELGLMGTDLGAGRLLYGYIIQDTNRGWGVVDSYSSSYIDFYFYSCHFSHYITQDTNRGWGVKDSYSYFCSFTLTRCCFL